MSGEEKGAYPSNGAEISTGPSDRYPATKRDAYVALIEAFATHWPNCSYPPVGELAKVALDLLWNDGTGES